MKILTTRAAGIVRRPPRSTGATAQRVASSYEATTYDELHPLRPRLLAHPLCRAELPCRPMPEGRANAKVRYISFG